jgi:hypothetical protein
MIITKEVYIKINNKNINHFKGIGYENLIINSVICIPVENLMKGSRTKIIVSCDICKSEKEISYKLYNYCMSKYNIYTCVGKCSNIKREKSSIDLFGVKNWMQSSENFEKYKKILLDKTGFDNPFKVESAQIKFKKTILERYGVENLSHSDEIYMKQQISGFSMKKHDKTGLYYRGTYELDFLNYCYNNNIGISQGKRFSYSFLNKNHYYFSDFFYEGKNLVVEIKSEYYYNRYIDINLAKRSSVINSGYNYILILNKKYDEFISTLEH